MLPTPTLSQEAEELNLQWVANDPVDVSMVALDVDWSGTYKAEVRDQPNTRGRLLAALDVTATLVDTDTHFRFVLADSSTVPNGGFWDCQQDDGPTRFAGRVIVVQSVTA